MIWTYAWLCLAGAALYLVARLARYLTRPPKVSRLSRHGFCYVVAHDRKVTADDQCVTKAARRLPRGSHATQWTAVQGEMRASSTDVTPAHRKKILS